jgi:acetyltransferase-like isoleucine patch superfamily enzyme
MAEFKYKKIEPPAESRARFDAWIAELDEFFTVNADPDSRSERVRDELLALYLVPQGERGSTAALNFDPRNATLEPEYYGDCDHMRYAPRKPLLWFWHMFDRSPAGMNHWLGFRVRAMLGKHIFAAIGKNVKIFHGVEFSFGYNLTIEDDCVIHKFVMLDDRGELILHRGTSISDYANVYTHTHDIHVQADITKRRTELGPDARITYHATVLAGSSVGENAMLGAFGLATKSVPPHVVSVGIPAKVVREKDLNKRRANAKPQPSE